jgi:uncharacterized spore protein YtfJ
MKREELKEVDKLKSPKKDEFVSSLAERLGATARASVVFADAVESEGVTVIPVAKARWGFGGGSGQREDEAGSGGGGGAVVSPIGFIEIRDGSAKFHRIHNVSLPFFAVTGLFGLWLLTRLLRR